jgi:hypothetical protein
MNGFSSDMRVIRFQPEWEYFLEQAIRISNIVIVPVVAVYALTEVGVILCRRRYFF